jgi:hypothetical protein
MAREEERLSRLEEASEVRFGVDLSSRHTVLIVYRSVMGAAGERGGEGRRSSDGRRKGKGEVRGEGEERGSTVFSGYLHRCYSGSRTSRV